MANEDKATRYHRLRRRARLLAVAWQGLLLLAILLTGFFHTLRDFIESVVGTGLIFPVTAYVVVLALLYELVALPLAFYQGVVLERRYGMSAESPARWWTGHVKAAVIVLSGTIVVALLLSSLLRWSPGAWWMSAAAALTGILLLLARFLPPLLLPLVYDVRPLGNDALRRRLVALAQRTGTPVLDVCEWQVGDHTRKANAALVGIGRTRRILLSDTLLEGHSDEEIEVVIAHELGHQVYGDIWSAIALDAVLLTVALSLTDVVLTASVAPMGLQSKADVAALPLLMLIGGTAWFAFKPVSNALSRIHERRADRHALEVTGNPAAFESAIRRLAARNLAEERPGRLVEILFHSHPSAAERIAAARGWTREGRSRSGADRLSV